MYLFLRLLIILNSGKVVIHQHAWFIWCWVVNPGNYRCYKSLYQLSYIPNFKKKILLGVVAHTFIEVGRSHEFKIACCKSAMAT